MMWAFGAGPSYSHTGLEKKIKLTVIQSHTFQTLRGEENEMKSSISKLTEKLQEIDTAIAEAQRERKDLIKKQSEKKTLAHKLQAKKAR